LLLSVEVIFFANRSLRMDVNGRHGAVVTSISGGIRL
jgi:hypothetical protein